MSVKFFGQFLLERGIIGRQALLEAIQAQEAQNLRLGEYAVHQGYLTSAQAAAVNRVQLTEDKRFGEIAVDLGLISGDQLRELLTLQQNDYLRLGEALEALGKVDAPILTRELEAFRDDQSSYQVGEVVFPAGIDGAGILAVPVDLTAKLLSRLAGLTCKVGAGERGARAPVDRLVTASITLSGDVDAHYTLSVSQDLARRIGAGLTGDGAEVDDDTCLDAVKELCNVVCGNAAARLAQLGRQVEIGPPWEGYPLARDGVESILFPLHVPDGAVEVRIAR